MKGFLLKYFGGIWGYVGVAVIAGALAAYATSFPYRLTISQMKEARANQLAADTKATLDQFVSNAKLINGAAGEFQGASADLNRNLSVINRNLLNAMRAKPLPPGCFPTSDRVQSLDAAIDAANTAAGRIAFPAVPPVK